jgi:hypothetical protein
MDEVAIFTKTPPARRTAGRGVPTIRQEATMLAYSISRLKETFPIVLVVALTLRAGPALAQNDDNSIDPQIVDTRHASDFDALQSVFSQYMPNWPATGLSYPTRILDDMHSAFVVFTDTPELFGGELRILGAIDFKDGKVVRWVDYWDSRDFDTGLYTKMRTPEEEFPTDFKEEVVGVTASPKIVSTASQLQSAFGSADAESAARLFS